MGEGSEVLRGQGLNPPAPSEGKRLSTLVPLLHYSPKSAEDKALRDPHL